MPSGTERPLILTGADSRFSRSLWQLLLSAERTGCAKSFRWQAFDLGMTDDTRKVLAERFPWCEFEHFPFERYPPHVALAANSYAWKPIIFADAVARASAPVFWFDSASILHSSLAYPLKIVDSHGLWALKGQSPLHQHCAPSVLAALDVPLELRDFTERAAGAIGVNPRHAAASRLVATWKRLCLDPSLVIPPDATRAHKRDQALWTYLLAKSVASGEITLTDDEIDISSPSPLRDITTRNKLDPTFPVWADPAARAWFAISKGLDQWAHRWNRFVDTRVDGLRRWRKEHFSVHVRNLETGQHSLIPSPRYGYYADPFVKQKDGRTWLFMEEFEYAKDKGRLVVTELDQTLAPGPVQPLTWNGGIGRVECHASFPCIFEIDGLPHMIPETSARRTVDLYACSSWPGQWHLKRRLLFDVDAADSMAFHHNGTWWLLTSVRQGGSHRYLEIYHTADLLKGTLHPHPQNIEKRYGTLAHGTGRNAGYLAAHNPGPPVRLMQYSTAHYGEGARLMAMRDLTAESFAEEQVTLLPGTGLEVAKLGTHHLSQAGPLVAYDVRDRVR